MTRNHSSFSGSGQFRYEAQDLDAMSEATNYYHWILDFFEPFKGENILEVGAGTGNLCSVIFERWKGEIRRYVALEPDPTLCRQLSARFRHISDADIQYLNDFLSDVHLSLHNQEIDTIFYVNVLEHVEDDRAELKRAADLLKKGGHLLTFTPAMPALYSRFDEKLGHYRRYKLGEMKQKIERTGLKIVKAHYVDFPGFFLWWLKYRVLNNTMIKKEQVRLYDRFVVPVLKKMEPHRYLPFGKNVIVIGEKT